MRHDRKYGLLFISPALLYFLLFWILPVVLSVYYSLTKWTVGRPPAFVGLKNFTSLLADPLFQNAVVASAKITVPAVAVTMLIAFGVALLLNDESLKGTRLMKLLIIMPVVTDWVATGLVWQLIFLPNSGMLAGLFHSMGLTEWMGIRWTSSRALAPMAIVLFSVWKMTGFYAILFLAGLKSVPKHVYEAAKVDGANALQTLWQITLPLIRPITVFVLVSVFVSVVGLFEPIFMLTGGGPADATRTVSIFLYETFFQFRNGGYASAAGVLFLLLCLLFALGAARVLRYSYYEQ